MTWIHRASCLLCLLLPACGTTLDQRLRLYQAGATVAGRPDVAAVLGAGRIILVPQTAAKQPRNVQP